MRIGKQDQPFSAICTSDADSITVRGLDLCEDIIGKFDFSSYFWFLVTGQQPNEQQSFFLNAVLCALAEHGLVEQIGAPLDIYRRPANTFVAGFIGSPKMNLLKARVVATETGRARVDAAVRSALDPSAPPDAPVLRIVDVLSQDIGLELGVIVVITERWHHFFSIHTSKNDDHKQYTHPTHFTMGGITTNATIRPVRYLLL